ncbi:hypothetical protein [Ekhidna sp.]|uniref:hypothetical protein n=1 Tax=Ekhidna sp. TaxID=2608089 RepID=UPI003296E093
MKQFIWPLMLLLSIVSYGQESTKKSSFLSRNKPVVLFPEISSNDAIPRTFQLKLPTEAALNQPYQSDFKSFMANDTRLMNYPVGELGQLNNVVFGNYMNTSLNLGNSTFNTVYIFDQTGRFVNSRTSFSFGRRN